MKSTVTDFGIYCLGMELEKKRMTEKMGFYE